MCRRPYRGARLVPRLDALAPARRRRHDPVAPDAPLRPGGRSREPAGVRRTLPAGPGPGVRSPLDAGLRAGIPGTLGRRAVGGVARTDGPLRRRFTVVAVTAGHARGRHRVVE